MKNEWPRSGSGPPWNLPMGTWESVDPRANPCSRTTWKNLSKILACWLTPSSSENFSSFPVVFQRGKSDPIFPCLKLSKTSHGSQDRGLGPYWVKEVLHTYTAPYLISSHIGIFMSPKGPCSLLPPGPLHKLALCRNVPLPFPLVNSCSAFTLLSRYQLCQRLCDKLSETRIPRPPPPNSAVIYLT